MVTAASTPPARHRPAEMSDALPNPGDGQQEQRPVQGAVDDEGHHVGRGELGRAEQAQRQHGHPHATFPGYESCEQQHAGDHRGQRGWSGPAADGPSISP